MSANKHQGIRSRYVGIPILQNKQDYITMQILTMPARHLEWEEVEV